MAFPHGHVKRTSCAASSRGLEGCSCIMLRPFWRCKAIHPHQPGELFHISLKKKPAHMTTRKPIFEPNVGPHAQKWYVLLTLTCLRAFLYGQGHGQGR